MSDVMPSGTNFCRQLDKTKIPFSNFRGKFNIFALALSEFDDFNEFLVLSNMRSGKEEYRCLTQIPEYLQPLPIVKINVLR